MGQLSPKKTQTNIIYVSNITFISLNDSGNFGSNLGFAIASSNVRVLDVSSIADSRFVRYSCSLGDLLRHSRGVRPSFAVLN